MSDAKEVTPTPTRGVPIMLDRERHLRFSLKTMKEMREKFGPDGLKKGFDQNRIAELLWFGLRGEDPELTVEAVEELVDLEHLGEVMDAVSMATGTHGYVEIAEAEEEDEAEDKQDADHPPTPASSSTDEPEEKGSGKGESPSGKKPALSKAS